MGESQGRNGRFFSGVVLGAVVSVVTLAGTAAMAGTSVGGLLHLGKNNTSNTTTAVTGTANKPLLKLTDKSKGSHSTALSLVVPAGHAPLAVNSTKKVTHLNADELDGLNSSDFQRPVASPCPSDGALTGVAQNGAPTCSGTVIIPISYSLDAGDSKGVALQPAPLFLSLDCHVPQRGTDFDLTNEGDDATLNWLLDDGTSVTATGVDFGPDSGPSGDQFFQFLGKRLEGQLIYKGPAYVATIDIHAFDGTSSCEYAGSIIISANPT